MMENNPRGAVLLRTFGILMIVAAAAVLILSVVEIFGIVLLLAAARQSAAAVEEIGVIPFLLALGGACMFLGAAAEFAAGVIGCRNCREPEKAGLCLRWGIVAAVLCAGGQAGIALGGGTLSMLTLGLGLLMPALFMIGALKNKP